MTVYVNLYPDAYTQSSGTNVSVNQHVPYVIASGTAATTYILPGDITNLPPGDTFPGYQLGTKFTIVNLSANTATIAAATNGTNSYTGTSHTLYGASSLGDGSTTPTVADVILVAPRKWYVSVRKTA